MKMFKVILVLVFCGHLISASARQSIPGINVTLGERPPIDLHSLPEDAFEPGILLIKFSNTHDKHLIEHAVKKSQTGTISFDIEAVDALIEKHAISEVDPVFGITATKNGFSEKHQAWGFHRWFRLHVDEKADIIQLVEEFAKLPAIEAAEPEYRKVPVWQTGDQPRANEVGETIQKSQWTPNDPLFNDQWHYHNTGQSGGQPGADIDMQRAWDIEKGNPNVIVAIIDDGVDFNHEDLTANMWSGLGYNFVDDMATIIPGFHGTHVAGTVAAVSNNNTGVAGIAGGSGSSDGVRLMSCQVFRELPDGQYLARGFEEALIYAADQGAAIAQNSWAYAQAFVYNLTVMDAIDYFILNGGGSAINNGGVAIFAAGNNNAAAPFFPAAYPGVIGVASTNRTDGKSSFSNYGYWVSISAPGTDVFSTDVNNTYRAASGTSMACPHVAGVVALVASKGYGQLTATEVIEIILHSADNHYFVNPDFIGKLGTGRLNAYNALLETAATLNNVTNPSGFTAVSSDPNTIVLQWSNNGNNDEVLIAWSHEPFDGSPADGTAYSAGQALPGGGTVLFAGQASQCEHTGLTASTKYHYKIWSKGAADTYSTGRICQETTQLCLPENQCTYTFRLSAWENQSWGGNYMTVEQGGKIVADLYKFCGSDFFDIEVALCNEMPFQLVGHSAVWPESMGVEIIGPYGNSIYKRVPEEPWGSNPVLFDGIADCVEPTCYTPSNIEITNNQTTEVTVAWTANNNAQLFNLEYGLWGYQPGQGALVQNISQSPYVLDGLLPGKRYELRMQADCGGGDMSFWSLPVYFETACSPLDVPLFEDFSHVPYRQIPLCWDRYGSDETADNNWAVWGDGRATLFHHAGSHANLVTPDLNQNLNQVRMYFDLVWSQYSGNLQVGTSHANNGTHVFTPMATFQSRLMYDFELAEKHVVYFDDIGGTDQQIAFRFGSLDATNPSWVFFDDILIETVPPCPEPYDLMLLNSTETAAVISWQQAQEIPAWEIKMGSIGFNPETQGTLIDGVHENPYAITELLPGTSYEVYIRAKCGSEVSGWSQSIVFSTQPALLTLPHTEDFNDCTPPFLPPGWKNTGYGMYNGFVRQETGHQNSPGLRMNSSFFHSSSLIVAPAFAVPVESIKLNFLAMSPDNITLAIGVISDMNDIGTFQTVKTIPMPSGLTYNSYSAEFNVQGLDPGWIAIKIQGTENEYVRLWLDNFVFEEIPDCAIPDNLHASIIDEQTIELSWNQPGFGTSWEIVYGIPGFDPDGGGISLQNITQNPYMLTGLTENSLYGFRVRATCAAELSDWSEPYLFATQCIALSLPYLENFDTYGMAIPPACWISNTAINVVDWMPQSPPYHLNMAAGDDNVLFVAAPKFASPINQIKLSLQMRRGQLANGLDVGVMTNVNDASTFQLVSHLTGSENDAYTDELIYFTGNYPAEGRITFRYQGSWHALMLDNILFEPIPNCPEPFNVQASTIDTYEATIVWSQAGTANQWELSFGVPGYDPRNEGTVVSNINNPNYLLEGLQANTAYEIYVRTVCGTEYSEWSVPAAIVTLQICQTPTSLSTTNVTTDAANLSWVQGGGAANWDILFGIAGFNPEHEGSTINDIEHPAYQLTGLQHSQYYEVYVRANCTGETSAWSAPWLFATECGGFDLPFAENFDQNLFTTIPLCWSSIRTGEGTGEITAGPGHSGSEPNSLYIYNQMHHNTAIIILPKIHLGNQILKLTFMAAHNTGGSLVEFGYIDNPSNPSTFSSFHQIDLEKKIIFQDYAVYFDPGNNQDKHIAMKYAGAGSIFLDDFFIEVAPSCSPAFNLVVNDIFDTSANLSWSSAGTNQSWSIKYGPSGFDPDLEGMLISNVMENEATLAGLNPGTYYHAYVKKICNEGASHWSLPVVFSTDCNKAAIPYFQNFESVYIPPLPPCWDAFISNGFLAIYPYENMLTTQSNAHQSVILMLPEFIDPLQYLTLNIIAKWRERDGFFEVGVISDMENPSTFQHWETLHYVDNELQNKGVSFDGFDGNPGRIALRFGFAVFSIDEIEVISLVQSHSITATAGTGGGISPAGTVSVSHGESQVFTITPDTSYEIADVLVDGESVGAVTTYTFESVTTNHTIEASFSNLSDKLHLAKEEHVTIAGEACFFSPLSIWVAGFGYDFTVQPGGDVTLVATESIHLLPGTNIASGARLHAHIAQEGVVYCAPTLTPEVAYETPKVTVIVSADDKPTQENSSLFKVYPNPTPGRFTLELTDIGENARPLVAVYGMRGELVLREELPAGQSHHELSLEGQLPGIYIVRVLSCNQAGVLRLLKL